MGGLEESNAPETEDFLAGEKKSSKGVTTAVSKIKCSTFPPQRLDKYPPKLLE
jgi:hypothetical protein